MAFATFGNMDIPPRFSRLALAIGAEGISALQNVSVAFFGLGGVGSWAAESLVRSGVGRIALIDGDTICVTNINRQLPATMDRLGQSKADVLAERFRTINPEISIEVRHGMYAPGDSSHYGLERFTYLVDAIDSLDAKVDLLISAQAAGCRVFSSMGAGNKLDPTQIRIGDIWNTSIDPLAKRVRGKLRERGFAGHIPCVYSLEKPLTPLTHERPAEATAHPRRVINASVAHVTAAFGQYLAYMVMDDVLKQIPR